MRTLISLGMAAFALGFVISADLFAAETWEQTLTKKVAAAEKETEKRLTNQGWVKLSVEELKALKNYTAVYFTGEAYYVDPTGTQFVYREMSGSIKKYKRKISESGRFCLTSLLGGDKWRCRFIWKKGDDYISHGYIEGYLGAEHKIKPGNTENL